MLNSIHDQLSASLASLLDATHSAHVAQVQLWPLMVAEALHQLQLLWLSDNPLDTSVGRMVLKHVAETLPDSQVQKLCVMAAAPDAGWHILAQLLVRCERLTQVAYQPTVQRALIEAQFPADHQLIDGSSENHMVLLPFLKDCGTFSCDFLSSVEGGILSRILWELLVPRNGSLHWPLRSHGQRQLQLRRVERMLTSLGPKLTCKGLSDDRVDSRLCDTIFLKLAVALLPDHESSLNKDSAATRLLEQRDLWPAFESAHLASALRELCEGSRQSPTSRLVLTGLLLLHLLAPCDSMDPVEAKRLRLTQVSSCSKSTL